MSNLPYRLPSDAANIDGYKIDLSAGATINQVLQYNGTSFVAGTVSGGITSTTWMISPVDEASVIGATTGAGSFTVGTRFVLNQAATCTGIRFYYPDSTSRTIKVSLWNNAGTRLANTSATYNSAGTKTLTFSGVSLTAYATYYVTTWDTAGNIYIFYATSNSTLRISSSDSVRIQGTPALYWTSWGVDQSGDVFPNTTSGSEIYPVDPILTVP